MRTPPRLASLTLGFVIVCSLSSRGLAQPREQPATEPIRVSAGDDEVLSPVVMRGDAPASAAPANHTVVVIDPETGLMIPHSFLEPIPPATPRRGSRGHDRAITPAVVPASHGEAFSGGWVFEPSIGLMVPAAPMDTPAPRRTAATRSRPGTRPARNPASTASAERGSADFHIDESTGLMIPAGFGAGDAF